jgi:hypothetical protein
MATAPRQYQVLHGTTITATGNSGPLPNIGEANSPYIVILINCPNAPTGTTPSVTFSLVSVLPDGSTVLIVAGTAITAAGQQRITASGVIDGTLEVVWTVSGTSPSFTGVNVDLFMSSPDN